MYTVLSIGRKIDRSRHLLRLSSTSTAGISTWESFESTHGSKIHALPEVQAIQSLLAFLKEENKDTVRFSTATANKSLKHTLGPSKFLLSLDSAMATLSLHVHARIASLVGKGFYTIGPCGEELLSSAALAFKPVDTSALHYRHTGISIARQLHENPDKSIQDLLLARARGYCVSKYDPVTGGVHCSIGGGKNEFLVTSTLSSQCPAAVGRALGFSLLQQQQQANTGDKKNDKPISYTTIGDGSLHNHHFLSSLTLARHAKHLKVKCPVVFGISNNGLSISYETKDYIDSVFPERNDNNNDPLLPVFRANGQDIMDIYDATKSACDYARQYQSPCVVLYSNLIRRFGHAATDRQASYLESSRIESMANTCVLQMAMIQAVEHLGITTYPELYDRLQEIHHGADQAFGQAIEEPKVTLDDMMNRVSSPLIKYSPPLPINTSQDDQTTRRSSKPQVMRKHMNQCFHEMMEKDSSIVYLGEDVRHGGYYLVTEDLAKAYPNRVLDFPPDETTLLGAALGFSQLGLLPIVEIPYAKYLDCGVDMFYEIAIQHWLSGDGGDGDGHIDSKVSGMIIRLQGFDRGLFGGNFHTHNMLSHMPPGVDVVCFSNGQDYVKGMRHALLQAKGGRIVMVVDCTNLLNLRHIHERDRSWEMPYPENDTDIMTFDEIRRYTATDGTIESSSPRPPSSSSMANTTTTNTTNTALITYGNGVVTCLKARRGLVDLGVISKEEDLDVIDVPYLSGISSGLEDALLDYDNVVFADICKEGPGSNVFSSMIVTLEERGTLPMNWSFVGAPRTYNPLGSTVTFLNQDRIENAVIRLLKRAEGK